MNGGVEKKAAARTSEKKVSHAGIRTRAYWVKASHHTPRPHGTLSSIVTILDLIPLSNKTRNTFFRFQSILSLSLPSFANV